MRYIIFLPCGSEGQDYLYAWLIFLPCGDIINLQSDTLRGIKA